MRDVSIELPSGLGKVDRSTNVIFVFLKSWSCERLYAVERPNYEIIDTEAGDDQAMSVTYVAGMPVNKNKMRSIAKGAGRLIGNAFKRNFSKENTVTQTD